MVFEIELQPTELPLQPIKRANLLTLLQSYILYFIIKQIKLIQKEKNTMKTIPNIRLFV